MKLPPAEDLVALGTIVVLLALVLLATYSKKGPK